MGIRNKIGKIDIRNAGGFSWAAYWAAHLFDKSDLLLNFDSRSGGTLIDSVSAETAQVLLPCFVKDGSAQIRGDKARASELLFDGNDHTIYFQFRLTDNIAADSYDLIRIGGWPLAERRGIIFKAYYDRIRIYCADGTTLYQDDLIAANATAILLNNGIFDCIVKIDGAGKTLKAAIYNSAGVLQGGEINRDISAFEFNANQNYAHFSFDHIRFVVDNFKKFSGVKTIVQCKTDTYVTGIVIHLPHVLTGIDISGNNNDFSHISVTATSIRYDFINEWALKYGYDYYYLSTATWFPIIIPYTATGGVSTPSYDIPGSPLIPSRIIGERPGTTSMLNLYDFGKIRFTNAFFDRSNATIWNDTCRAAAGYDAVNTKDFLISSLNYRTLYGWLNDGYRGRLYINYTLGSIEQFDRQSSLLSNIYLYSTDHKGTENRNILTYTKDIKCAVLSGTSITYDAENYVKIGTLKTIKPMLSFRQDDCHRTLYVNWYPYFNNQGIKVVFFVIQEVTDTVNYCSLEQLKIMYDNGFIPGWHSSTYAVDYSYDNQCLQLEPDIISVSAWMTANNIPPTHLAGHRFSSVNPSLGYYANKHGFKSNSVAALTASARGANPQIINKFNLYTGAIDYATSPFNLDLDDASAELQNIKDELTLCASENRLLVLYFHDYVARVKDGIDAVIIDANAKGVEIVSIDEALANCKYL